MVTLVHALSHSSVATMLEHHLTHTHRRASSKYKLKRLVAGFPPRRPGFEPGSGHVRFVVHKVALGQVFSEYFGFPCQSSFHQLLQKSPSSIIWGWYNRPEVAAVPSGLSPTPRKKKYNIALLRLNAFLFNFCR
jgi:hypothetical protein